MKTGTKIITTTAIVAAGASIAYIAYKKYKENEECPRKSKPLVNLIITNNSESLISTIGIYKDSSCGKILNYDHSPIAPGQTIKLSVDSPLKFISIIDEVGEMHASEEFDISLEDKVVHISIVKDALDRWDFIFD